MPLPFIIGGLAIAAGATGIGSGIHGGVKMKEANDTMKQAKEKQEAAVERFEKKNKSTTEIMDSLGTLELKILKSFEQFSDTIEKIQNRPDFKNINLSTGILPEYEAEELKKVSAGAGVLLGGVGGAAAGTAGGFAAAGATTSAVMALGTASTGTAISSLSGVAATNATLAALGGGSIAAGGGGMALGTAVLGGATLGVGLLVGGIIFNVTGSKLSDKADEALKQAERTEKEVNKIYNYLYTLSEEAQSFRRALYDTNQQYQKLYRGLDYCVNFANKTNWLDFTDDEKKNTENCVLLVGLLFKMCQTQIVKKDTDGDGLNTINKEEIKKAISNSKEVLHEVA